jgi:ubiquinone/menaquinone biosynthesis C-methylase UbiE
MTTSLTQGRRQDEPASHGIPLSRLEQLYNQPYYLADCEGHERFAYGHGRRLSKRLKKCFELLDPQPNENVVDVGCGRGEIVLNCVARGARAIALDVSSAALQLIGPAAQQWTIDPTEVMCLRARIEAMPIRSEWADALVMSDIIEHIPGDVAPVALAECYRVLKPGGRLIIHTQPNRRLVDTTVPILARWSRYWNVKLPSDLRMEMTDGAGPEYHVNEQTRGQLARCLRQAGFRIEQLWLEGTYPIHRIFGDSRLKPWLIRQFRQNRWLRELFASQIFAVARR